MTKSLIGYKILLLQIEHHSNIPCENYMPKLTCISMMMYKSAYYPNALANIDILYSLLTLDLSSAKVEAASNGLYGGLTRRGFPFSLFDGPIQQMLRYFSHAHFLR